VQRLQQDHGWLEEDWRELRPMLATIAEGYAWHEPEALRQMAAVFGALYLEHVALEESLIYPAAKERLAAAESAGQRRSGS
jgi:hemerythrin-like domain-containing protein